MKIQAMLGSNTPYWDMCREERNFVALLYSALLQKGNLSRFLDNLHQRGIAGGEWITDVETIEVYVEFSLLRDLWDRTRPDPATALNTIYGLLGTPPFTPEQNTLEFNSGLVGGPPSSTWIQNPGRWSIAKIDQLIPAGHDRDFLRACKFKWSFNVKPDMVMQQHEGNRAIVVEAKFASPLGRYPSSAQEKAIFAQRHLPRVTQLDIQRFLFEEVLGVTYVPLMIKEKRGKVPSDPTCSEITWTDAFAGLDLATMTPFARTFIASKFGHDQH
jgi:hypothetical protein